jgi:phosphoglycerol transferase MdoB-like AlkP superfamily enzyme
MYVFDRITDFFFPEKAMRTVYLLLFSLFFFKFLWFDFSWCMISTYRPFSYIETYLCAAILATVLTLPFAVFRMTKTTFVLAAAAGILLLSNLIYFRTYYTAIPLSSYGLIGNMSGYTSSISASLHWMDALFPVSTVAAIVLYRKFYPVTGKEACTAVRRTSLKYALLPVLLIFVLFIILFSKGGFKTCYGKLQGSYTHTCGPVIYTVFGSVYYDYIRDKEVYTPEIGNRIKEWFACDTVRKQIPYETPSRTNCIIILAESFESWVLERSVENREITPYLNRLLRDSSTLFAPKVLSQVKGGRSIDAQLMINTGLLPINAGTYSLKYPYSLYPSLEKAMKEKYAGKSKAFVMTADKPVTWNQNVIAKSFGFDSLLSRKNFIQDEKTGPHYRHQLSDVSLLRQCAGKITGGAIRTDEAFMIQIVTYSGHFPFTLPERMKELTFPEQYPAMLQDYMNVARYTDKAIGQFIEEIRRDSLYENTLIVITGDHEGLTNMRDDWCSTEQGRGLVSPHPFVPLIIINAPASLRSQLIAAGVADTASACIRYDKVMGQMDIYPTLLDLLGLSGYQWRGLGTSMLNPERPTFAIDPQNNIYGNTTRLLPAEIQHLNDAWQVSDAIIRYDFFRRQVVLNASFERK